MRRARNVQAKGEKKMKILIAIAGAAALQVTSVQAQLLSDTYTVKVGYADLDMNRASGRAALERRVRAAIERVCGPPPAPPQLRQSWRYRACKIVAWDGVQPQLAEMYGGWRPAKAELHVSAARAN
jgi:UrcA family protein